LRAENAISWNQIGPKGDRGAMGAPGQPGGQGQPGVQGPTGPSDGYFTSNDGQTALSLNFGSGGTSVAHLDVPAGSYLIEAKADLGHSVVADSISEGCILRASSDSNGETIFLPGGASSEDDVVVPYQTAHTFTSAGVIDLSCYLIGFTGGDSGFAQHVRLSAVNVGSLHVQ
jgi:hypothetical protein